MQLHNKQNSVARLRISIARDQERLARLEKEEAALKAGKTVHVGKRTRSVIQMESPPSKAPRTKQDEAETRVVIKYFYRQLDSPPEEDWDQQCGLSVAPSVRSGG